MLKAFATVLLFCYTYAFTVENDCSLGGPNYWCASEQNAKFCDATAYCREHVWKTNQQPNDLCVTCETEIDKAHQMLKSNEAAVIEIIKNYCAKLPSEVKDTCAAFVDVYGKAAIDKIVAMTNNSQALCTMVGLCKKESVHAIGKDLTVSTDFCMTCQQYAGTVHMLLANKQTQEAIISELHSACSGLPSVYGPVCSEVVNLYAQKGIDWLVNYLEKPKNFCTTIGLCGKTFVPLLHGQPMLNTEDIFSLSPQVNKESKNGSLLCSICVILTQLTHDFLVDNTTRKAGEEWLENICSYVPEEFFSKCLVYVINNEEKIYNIILSSVTPDRVCGDLCKITEKNADTNIEKLTAIFEKVAPAKTHKPKKSNAVTCELCSMAISYLSSMLKENSTEEEIKVALDKVCSFLPGEYADDCTELVTMYEADILNVIIQELDNPVNVCKELGLCGNKKNLKEKKLMVVTPLKQVKNAVTCELCTMAMSYLESVLKEQSTEAEIKTELDKMCAMLPADVKTECDSLVTEYSDQIIKILVQSLANPNDVCKLIGVCKSAKKVKTSSVTCEICTMGMQYLDRILEGKTSKADVEAALDKLCSYLPAVYSSECVTFVNTYGGEVIDIIVREIADPSAVCQELHLCAAKKQAASIPKLKMHVDIFTCSTCQLLMGAVDSKKATGDEIRNVLYEYAKKLSHSDGADYNILKKFADKHADMIASLIAQGTSAKDVCKIIGLCEAVKKQAKHVLALRSSVSCEVCQYAMGFLDNELKDKTVEKDIEHEVESLCKKLPSAIGTECNALVAEYGDELIKLISEEIKPAEICQKIHLC